MSEDVDLGMNDEAPVESMSDALSSTLDAAFDEAEGIESAAEDKDPAPEIASDDAVDDDAPDEVDGSEAASPPTAAPTSMSAKQKEAFALLPPESQKWLADRERQMTADYTRKTTETAEKGRVYERLEQVLAPRREQLQMQGMDDSTAIGQLFSLSDFANRDPVGFTTYLLQNRGIDPAQAFSAQAAARQNVDPAIAATQRELQSIRQFIQSQTETQAAQQHATALSAVESFVQESGKDGQPLRPHYAKLEPEMIPIVEQLRRTQPGKAPAEYLQQSYERAVWANPETRELMKAETNAKTSAEALVRAKGAAAKARKSASSNVSTTGFRTGDGGKNASLEDTLSSVFDSASSAA